MVQIVKDTERHISQKEFEHLFKDNYSDLCAYAKLFLGDIEAAEEIVQDLFVKYWENRESVVIIKSVRSYLFKSVRNSCLNFIKHRKIEEHYKQYNAEERESGSFGLDVEYEGTELEIKIRKAIDSLPPERKKIFIMCRFEGLKYKEIAEKTGISVKTVENQMGKAGKFLKDELADYFPIMVFLLLNRFYEF